MFRSAVHCLLVTLAILVLSHRAEAQTSCGFAAGGLNQDPSSPLGGSYSLFFSFTASSGCTWGVQADVPWVTFTGLTSSANTTTTVNVPFVLSANSTNVPRTGQFSFFVNGALVASAGVTQNSANCVFSYTPSQLNLPVTGGTGSFTMNSVPAGCAVTGATSNTATWITVSASSEIPNVAPLFFTYTAQPNSGGLRSGSFGVRANPPYDYVYLPITEAGLPGPLSLTCFPAGGPTIVGTPYAATCTVTGGTAPYNWSINPGALPGGLKVTLVGDSVIISGVPDSAGDYSYGVRVTDSSAIQLTATQAYSGTITSPLSLSCNPAKGPTTVGTSYTATCTVTGGASPYNWSINPGALPTGLTLSPSGDTATISGAPTVAGSYSYTVRVTDSSATPQTATQAYSGTVISALSLSCNPVTGPTTVGTSYTATCTLTGGTSPYTWAINPGSLPSGLTLTPSGGTATIRGTATGSGDYSYTVRATDSSATPQTATQAYSGTVTGTGITITTSPPGLQIIVDGSTFTAPQTFIWAPGTGHEIGVPSPQGSGGSRLVFTSWSDGGAQSHTFTASSSATYTASFKTQYLLTTAVSPAGWGAVTASPSSGDGFYDSDISVTLTATGSFQSWSGDLSGSANPQSVVMNAPRSVTATFTLPIPQVTLPRPPASPTEPINAGVTLTAPAPIQLNGTLTLTFQSNAAGTPANYRDPATQFASGGTTVDFTVPTGTAIAMLPQNGAIQQGTVAGTITVTLTRLVAGTTSVIPPAPVSTTLSVPQLAPVILPGSVKITGLLSSGFNVEFDAFSTPRDLGDLNLAFQPAAGAKLTGTSFTVPLQSLAPSWFSSPAGLQSGGSFHLSVPFTFSGDTRSIGSVSVTLSNSIGTSVPHTSGP